MRGVVSLADARLPVLASWLEDTPSQLVTAARAALLGEEAHVLWVEEPDSKVWTLTPEAGSIRLLVQGCAGLGPDDLGSFVPTSEETYLLPRRDFVVGVLAGMDALALALPVARYEAEWHHPWPRTDLADLRRALGNPVRSHHRQVPRAGDPLVGPRPDRLITSARLRDLAGHGESVDDLPES